MNNDFHTPTSLTPAGRLRRGFRYQDLLAIERLVEWLLDTERFRWVKAEADDGGFLDDLQAMRRDGVLELWQIKFSTNPNAPDDPWTWEALLHREKGKRGLKTSLLQKWHTTWRDEKSRQPVEALLVSNRRASLEFEACLSPRTTAARTALWNEISTSVRAEIAAQLGSEANAQAFLAGFRWRLGEPQLQELERGALARFERIGGTTGAWERLWRAATLWIEGSNEPAPDGRISLEDVQRAAGLRAHPVKLHTFLPPSAFFERYTHQGRIFHHRCPLVGRREELGALLTFVTDAKHQIALLPGRGGNGKSRLIAALCRRLAKREPDLPVRIIAENVPLTAAALDELPDERCLLILDDAHRGSGLEVVLGAARQNPGVQVLLIARPHAVDFLSAQIGEFGFDSTERQLFPPLQDLSPLQVRQVARLTLGREHAAYAEELASVTRDCPLLTILGGQLLRDRQIEPSLLAHNDTFRQEVLGRFRDITLGKAVAGMDGRFSPELCAKVLPFVALTTPLDRTHTQLLTALASLIGTDESTLERLLDALVTAGVLLRGGRFMRLVPDVLSDFILQDACFSSDGHPVRWADDAFKALRDVCPEIVLRNLAELDWRIRVVPNAANENQGSASRGDGSSLLNGIWRAVEEEFRDATLSKRQAWFKRVERLAFTQPEPLWRLIEIARHDPKLEDPEEHQSATRHYFKPTTQDGVMGAAIPLLRDIARHEQFTARCCDLLWELGRDCEIESPNIRLGALTTLEGIASYKGRKPLVFQIIVLGCCCRWLRDPKVHTYQHSVLDIIAPLLERVPRQTYSNERYIAATPHPASGEWHKSLWGLRDGALDLVEECAKSPRCEVVLRAVECLKHAISEEGLYGLNRGEDEANEAERQTWEQEQLRAINIAANVVDANKDPFVCLTIREALHLQSCGPRPAVRGRAREVFEGMLDSFDMRFVRAYAHSHHCVVGSHWDESEEDERWQRRGEETSQLCGEVAKEFVDRYSETRDGFQALGEWQKRIQSSLWWTGIRPGLFKGMWTLSNDFLLRLTHDFPDYACGLLEAALELPEDHSVFSCTDILAELRRRDVALSAGMAARLVATQHPNLCHRVAESYAWRGWPAVPTPQDWNIIEGLLAFPHPTVKRMAAKALSSIAATDARRAVEMALAVEPSADSDVAETLFECFETRRGFDFQALTNDELTLLLAKLENVDSVDSYHIGRFLLSAMLRAPLPTTQMLLRRVERKRSSYWNLEDNANVDVWNRPEWNALPEQGFHDDSLYAIANHPDYREALRAVRDYILVEPGLSYRDNTAALFHTLSCGWNQTSLDVLNEWIDSGDEEKVKHIADLLESTFIGFYAGNVPFVSNYLNRARECGFEVLESVESALLHHATFGPARAMASHRGEQSNELVDNALRAFESSELDELTRRFFRTVEAEGRRMLRQEAEEREAEAIFFHR